MKEKPTLLAEETANVCRPAVQSRAFPNVLFFVLIIPNSARASTAILLNTSVAPA
jgi:hypothetical protein